MFCEISREYIKMSKLINNFRKTYIYLLRVISAPILYRSSISQINYDHLQVCYSQLSSFSCIFLRKSHFSSQFPLGSRGESNTCLPKL